MNSQEYTITQVQPRDDWTGAYGPMKAFALRLEGVDDWVSVNQKPETPAPEVGNKLYGHMDTKTSRNGEKTWLQFKKEARPDGSQGSSTNSTSSLVGDSRTMDYIVTMLEELTGRREKPDGTPTDDEVDKPIDLDEIPF